MKREEKLHGYLFHLCSSGHDNFSKNLSMCPSPRSMGIIETRIPRELEGEISKAPKIEKGIQNSKTRR